MFCWRDALAPWSGDGRTVSCTQDNRGTESGVMYRQTIFVIRSFVALFLLSSPAAAQFTYSLDQTIPVEISGRFLDNPWAGGINSAQFNTLDLNDDGVNDLIVFDRASGRLVTFLNEDNEYRHAPDYARLFPPGVSHWMLLRDFNCDGKKDLFTSDPFGISVYVNTTTGGQLSWRAFNNGLPLLTIGFSGNINLKVNESDLPAIDDIDGDGDLDVLNVRFAGLGTVEWHKNLSIENTGQCDSLQFQRVTQNYGNFEECSCGVFAFGQTCADLDGGGRTAHIGGKNLLSIDLDNDGDHELLFSEESCNRLYALNNTGTLAAASYTSVGLYSFSTTNIPLFPAPFVEDVDFDGKKDLLISPNLSGRTYTNWLVENSVYLFRNTGTTQAPVFNFVKNDFLQDEMIELGDYSVPAFGDVDGDGDDDMIVGTYANENFVGRIFHFENTGTATLPSFRLTDNDYFGLTNIYSYNFKPQIVDMNGDGRLDIAFTSTGLSNGITSLRYLRNVSDEGIRFNSESWIETNFNIGVTENLSIVDVNLDGKVDFLIGKATGALEYWENTDPSGGFNSMVKRSGSYLGQANNTSQLNAVVATGDLDADGIEDLAMGTHRGTLKIFPDFRNFDPDVSDPLEDIIFNPTIDSVVSINLGGRIWPTTANLFGSDKPAIIVGNTTGGLQVLKNVEGRELPEEPVITLFPNPIQQGDTLKVVSDRPASMEVFSSLGQRMSDAIGIPPGSAQAIAIKGLSSGLYIARFTIKGKYYSRRFIIN
jgi:hypothetical protein